MARSFRSMINMVTQYFRLLYEALTMSNLVAVILGIFLIAFLAMPAYVKKLPGEGTMPELLCVPNAGVAGTGFVIYQITLACLTMGIAIICLMLTLSGGLDNWHQAFDKLLLGFGMNQLIIGIALTCVSLVKYGWFPKDMHANFSYQLGCLASSSYNRDPDILLKPRSHRKALVLRKYCSYIYVALAVCLVPGIMNREDYRLFGILSAIGPCLLAIPMRCEIPIDWLMDCNCQDRGRHDIYCSQSKMIEHTRLLYWMSGLPVFTWSMWYIITLKWKHASEDCDFNTREEDQWTFGQILAVMMLISCLSTAHDVFREDKVTEPETER